VAESFGFTLYLRSMTGGRAFPQCVFDHWQPLNTDPLEAGSKAAILVESIRKRKGLQGPVPDLKLFHDKL
jgi:elongation factor 2